MVICTRLNNIDIYNQCDVGTELLFPNLKVQIVHIVIKSNPHPSWHVMSCLIVSYTAARVVLCVFRVFPSLHHTVLAQTTRTDCHNLTWFQNNCNRLYLTWSDHCKPFDFSNSRLNKPMLLFPNLNQHVVVISSILWATLSRHLDIQYQVILDTFKYVSGDKWAVMCLKSIYHYKPLCICQYTWWYQWPLMDSTCIPNEPLCGNPIV